MGYFYKEINKLIGASNYSARMKRIYLILTEQEVMEYVSGEFTKPEKDKTQEVEK